MVLLVQVAMLLHLLQLFLSDPSVKLLLVIFDKLGEIPLATVFDAEDMLVLQQDVDYVLPLLGVGAQDLDGLIVVIVLMDCLKVNLRHSKLIAHADHEALKRVPIVQPFIPYPNV